MDQNELKRLVGKAALNYVKDGDVLGVGTGSTVDCFIDALAQSDIRPSACVSSSERSTKKLIELGFKVIDLSEVEEIGVYVDGADEINSAFEMIKGGGGALTREKIVASVAKTFVCIADESKLVKTLGKFPLPVEVIPMAVSSVARSLRKLGADPVERDFTTDNGCRILDCRDFMIDDPKAMEQTINALPGVVTVGLFARAAQMSCCLVPPKASRRSKSRAKRNNPIGTKKSAAVKVGALFAGVLLIPPGRGWELDPHRHRRDSFRTDSSGAFLHWDRRSSNRIH